jgi:hypothetical protein
MPNSLFNQNVTGWAVNADSAILVQAIVTDYKAAYGQVGVNTMPIIAVPAGTPSVPVSVASGCNNFVPSTGSSVPIPSYVVLNGSSDNPLVLYSTSLNRIWEFWQASRSGAGYTACWGGSAVLSTFDGVFPSPYGMSATGISYGAATITDADVASGSVKHAVAFILTSCNGYVYPADRGDCGTTTNQPAEGQWFRFAPGTAMPSGLTPFGQMTFKAILTYGMVITDQGGAVMLEAEQPEDWAAAGNSGTGPVQASWEGQEEYQVVANLPWADLQAINPPGAVTSRSSSPLVLPRPWYPAVGWPAPPAR